MRIFFIIIVLILSCLVYGVYRLDWASKNYEMTKRYFPAFMIWPKDVNKQKVVSKILFPLFLLVFITLLFLDLTKIFVIF